MIFAAGAAPPFFVEIAALIAAGALIGYVCYRLGLVPIVGFLVAGVLIGPNALGLVQDRALVDAAAEVGVILLLFTIGIEFSLEKLAKIKTLIFGGGGLQVALATLSTMGLLFLFDVSWQAALFTGFLVALSSTAIVLKLLGDRGEMNTEPGQVALGLLIFQDLAIIVMVMLVPMLAGTGGGVGDVAVALGKAALLIVAVLVVARRLMPLLIERVARTCSQELFLLVLIAICFGTAYLTSLADVSLSLGAFLAGLMVSESRYSEHAFGEIMPLQIVFSATFFISVGMLLDLGFLVTNLPLILGVLVAVLVIKLATTAIAAKALGYAVPTVAASSLILAQVGEFSFVLERAGRDLGLTPAGLGESGSQTFIAATVVLMVLTPILSGYGSKLAVRLRATMEPEEEPLPGEPEVDAEAFEHMANHTIIAGYGKAARRLVRVLHGSGIPHLVITLSPSRAKEAEALGVAVLRGDILRQHTLEVARIGRAKALVIPDEDPEVAHKITLIARMMNPTLRIVGAARRLSDVEHLEEAGVDRVIVEELESIVQLFAAVMHDYQVDAKEIEQHVDTMRAEGYVALRRDPDATAPPVVCRLDAPDRGARTVHVREGAPAAYETLGTLDLTGRFGLDLRRLMRHGVTYDAPEASSAVLPGDDLVLEGPPEAFEAAGPLFRTPVGVDRDGSTNGAPGPGTDDGEGAGARPEVYGTDWCILTGGFRAYFKRKEIPFTYYNIEKDPRAEERVRAMNEGKLKFPMVVVGERVMKNPPLDMLEEALAHERRIPARD